MTLINVYRVETTCGRLFAWSAVDLEQVFRDFIPRGFLIKKVQLLSEYEKEMGK
jgi:hypothetical protein